MNGKLVHRSRPPGQVLALQNKIGAAPAQIMRRGFKFELHIDRTLHAHVIHRPQHRAQNRLPLVHLLRRRRLRLRKSIVVNRPADVERQVEELRLRIFDLDVVPIERDVGVDLVKIGRFAPHRIPDIGVGNTRAIDHSAPAPPTQPGDADPRFVNLEHHAFPRRVAIDGHMLRQHRAGRIQQKAVHVDRKREDVPPLDRAEKIVLGRIRQPEKAEPEKEHEQRHGQHRQCAEADSRQHPPHPPAVGLHRAERESRHAPA